ncbi:hypothetical protein Slin14017_G063610 [Septoria linicola]|nr:hypothetical protein Slin14017_G063610 [Septoria linicola]
MKTVLVASTASLAAAAAVQHAQRTDQERRLTFRATLPYYLEFHYSNDFVTVGDTDLFAAIWQQGYASGDSTGIKTDDSYKQYDHKAACVWEDSSPDLEVAVKMSGNWGVVSGVEGMQVRNQLIKTMWELVEKIQEEDGVIWKDCRGCGLGGCSDNPKAVCGQFRPTMCACQKNHGGGGEAMDLCFGSSKNMLWSQAINETYIEYPLSSEAEDKGEAPDLIDWPATVVSYAKKCKIDLAQQSVAGLDDVLDSIRIRPLIGNAKVEKWKWTELVSSPLEPMMLPLTRTSSGSIVEITYGGPPC